MEKRVTFHEAGHAVVNVLLGLPFKEVTVELKKRPVIHNGAVRLLRYTDGIVFGEERKLASRQKRMEGIVDLREALSYLAGPKAEEMVVGKFDDECRQGAVSDFGFVVECCRNSLSTQILSILPEPETLEDGIISVVSGQAGKLLKANWSSVEAVANELNRRKRLSFKEVVRIVEGKVPTSVMDRVAGLFKGLLDRLDVA